MSNVLHKKKKFKMDDLEPYLIPVDGIDTTSSSITSPSSDTSTVSNNSINIGSTQYRINPNYKNRKQRRTKR